MQFPLLPFLSSQCCTDKKEVNVTTNVVIFNANYRFKGENASLFLNLIKLYCNFSQQYSLHVIAFTFLLWKWFFWLQLFYHVVVVTQTHFLSAASTESSKKLICFKECHLHTLSYILHHVLFFYVQKVHGFYSVIIYAHCLL